MRGEIPLLDLLHQMGRFLQFPSQPLRQDPRSVSNCRGPQGTLYDGLAYPNHDLGVSSPSRASYPPSPSPHRVQVYPLRSDHTHILPTPVYSLLSWGTVASSRIVNWRIFLSRSLD